MTTRAAAADRAERVERGALFWVVQSPERALPFLDLSFFVGDVHRRAFTVLADHGEVHEAIAAATRDDDQHVVHLLHELANAEAVAELEEAVAALVHWVVARALRELTRRAGEGDQSAAADVGHLKTWVERLGDPTVRVAVLNQLVPWLVAWVNPPN